MSLSGCCYRSLAKGVRQFQNLLHAHDLNMARELSFFPKLVNAPPLPDSTSFSSCILKPFFSKQFPLTMTSPRGDEFLLKDEQEAFQFTFQMLRQIHFRIDQLESEEYKKKPDDIKHRVGQIFQHKHYRYWGVIVGYDQICQQSSGWMKKMKVTKKTANKPFYKTIYVEGYDEEENGNLKCSYVPEENVIRSRNITPLDHPHLQQIFEAYMPLAGAFELNENMAQLYPDDAYWIWVQRQYMPECLIDEFSAGPPSLEQLLTPP